ncbi:MAG: imidazole glycerol phosphate synthase subunit HisH [Candidatus Omnitrophica bacterium]|nr:imidazole glycerol phosphate synthase subunit HisH [Candidatus Omnitrophota bacterium]
MKIAVIDYGMGNIHSVSKAVEVCGGRVVVTGSREQIESCSKIILPGVGAFDDAVCELERLGLVDFIKEQAEKKPLLGICLGMQLLFESSQEARSGKGLGIFKGKVVKFSSRHGEKIPHMGWNNLSDISEGCPLTRGIKEGEQVYFCHSYYAEPAEKDIAAASCVYGVKFACAFSRGNVYGVQFHPEKSQAAGLKIFRNFVELC